MFVDAQYSLGNDAPTFADEQYSAGNGSSTFIDAHYSTADGAPTFADTQHSQINGAPMFVDAPFRFEVQYLVKKAAKIDSTRQKYKVLPVLVAICGECLRTMFMERR